MSNPPSPRLSPPGSTSPHGTKTSPGGTTKTSPGGTKRTVEERETRPGTPQVATYTLPSGQQPNVPLAFQSSPNSPGTPVLTGNTVAVPLSPLPLPVESEDPSLPVETDDSNKRGGKRRTREIDVLSRVYTGNLPGNELAVVQQEKIDIRVFILAFRMAYSTNSEMMRQFNKILEDMGGEERLTDDNLKYLVDQTRPLFENAMTGQPLAMPTGFSMDPSMLGVIGRTQEIFINALQQQRGSSSQELQALLRVSQQEREVYMGFIERLMASLQSYQQGPHLPQLGGQPTVPALEDTKKKKAAEEKEEKEDKEKEDLKQQASEQEKLDKLEEDIRKQKRTVFSAHLEYNDAMKKNEAELTRCNEEIARLKEQEGELNAEYTKMDKEIGLLKAAMDRFHSKNPPPRVEQATNIPSSVKLFMDSLSLNIGQSVLKEQPMERRGQDVSLLAHQVLTVTRRIEDYLELNIQGFHLDHLDPLVCPYVPYAANTCHHALDLDALIRVKCREEETEFDLCKLHFDSLHARKAPIVRSEFGGNSRYVTTISRL